MREEISLRDGNSSANRHHHGNGIFSAHAALLRKIYSSRNELRKKSASSKIDGIELLRESQEYWAAFDESVLRWNDHLQSLGDMRKEISDRMLDESSDRVRAKIRKLQLLIRLCSNLISTLLNHCAGIHHTRKLPRGEYAAWH